MSTTTPTTSESPAIVPSPVRRKKKSNGEAGILAVLGAIVVVGGGAFALLSRQNNLSTLPPAEPPVQLSTTQIMDELLKNVRHERGPKNATFTVVEFADVECRYCRETYNNLLKKFEKRDDIRFVFFQYPLPPETHQYAEAASLALEAAGKQNKFWPMYDALFTGKEARLRDGELVEAAKKIGLNVNRFNSDIKDENTWQLVEKEKALAERVGVSSTPTFFVRYAKSDKVLRATGEKTLREMIEEPRKAGFFGDPAPDSVNAPKSPKPMGM